MTSKLFKLGFLYSRQMIDEMHSPPPPPRPSAWGRGAGSALPARLRAASSPPRSLCAPQSPAPLTARLPRHPAPPRPASPPPAFPMDNRARDARTRRECPGPGTRARAQAAAGPRRGASPGSRRGLPDRLAGGGGVGGRHSPALTRFKATDPGATSGVSLCLARSPAVRLLHTTSKESALAARCSPGLARRLRRRAPSTARPSSAGVRSAPARGGRAAHLRVALHHSAAEAAGRCSLSACSLEALAVSWEPVERVWSPGEGPIEKILDPQVLTAVELDPLLLAFEAASFHVENCLWRGPGGREV
ncbi:serine/arginine repetitive matrix protein 1-like [Ovis canadensis]|uniref:serine/arginine repetitive matrix protein 1-like n=1 Tax=Ovis canadensis TaxID=37174 RepID=UPI0038B5546D